MARQKGRPFAELLAAFQAKMDGIPPELRRFVPEYLCYRMLQDQRKAWANRVLQATRKDAKVAWATVLSPEDKALLAVTGGQIGDGMESMEKAAARGLEAIRDTDWFQSVALPAAKGYIGAHTACALLVGIGTPSRFATIGKLWAYCGLDVRAGRAPSTWRRVAKQDDNDRAALVAWRACRTTETDEQSHYRYNDHLLSALFNLSEVWNKASVRVKDSDGNPVLKDDGKVEYALDPNCWWRHEWDRLKAEEQTARPGLRPSFYHAKARRKVLRVFLRDLWRLWLEWELAREGAA